jgi:hypothetical protein
MLSEDNENEGATTNQKRISEDSRSYGSFGGSDVGAASLYR